MRAEDKQLEGPELEQAATTERQIESDERVEEELPQLAGEEVRDAELQHRSRLFDALRAIVSGEKITVSLLGLPQREAHALEALQTAVTGRDVHMHSFVFAEDRRSLLEQSLAILQANLTFGDAAELAELHGRYDALVGRIGALRDRLSDLENAQDDLFDEKKQYAEKKDDGDKDDDEDDDKADDEDDDKADDNDKAGDKADVKADDDGEGGDGGELATGEQQPQVAEDASISDLVGAALLAFAGEQDKPEPPPQPPPEKPPLKRRRRRG